MCDIMIFLGSQKSPSPYDKYVDYHFCEKSQYVIKIVYMMGQVFHSLSH